MAWYLCWPVIGPLPILLHHSRILLPPSPCPQNWRPLTPCSPSSISFASSTNTAPLTRIRYRKATLMKYVSRMQDERRYDEITMKKDSLPCVSFFASEPIMLCPSYGRARKQKQIRFGKNGKQVFVEDPPLPSPPTLIIVSLPFQRLVRFESNY